MAEGWKRWGYAHPMEAFFQSRYTERMWTRPPALVTAHVSQTKSYYPHPLLMVTLNAHKDKPIRYHSCGKTLLTLYSQPQMSTTGSTVGKNPTIIPIQPNPQHKPRRQGGKNFSGIRWDHTGVQHFTTFISPS